MAKTNPITHTGQAFFKVSNQEQLFTDIIDRTKIHFRQKCHKFRPKLHKKRFFTYFNVKAKKFVFELPAFSIFPVH